MTSDVKSVPSVSVSYARIGNSTKANALGMRPMQERAYERRGEQYLLIKSPPASGTSRALMFIALDKLHNQGLKQAVIVVPEKTIGASFNDEPLTKFGFWADWTVQPKWNLCNAPGSEGGKVNSVGAFRESDDKVLVCTHATFRFAVDKFGVEKFDDRLIAVDEFHHVSVSPDNKLGLHLGQFIARDRAHIVAMTGSYFRGDAEAVLAPQDEAKFDTVTDPAVGPLFAGESVEGDSASGTIYVLRSKSDNPVVAVNRDLLHKIGVTGGDVPRRIANAKIDPTFLLADVEIIATYELYNINRTKLENLVHRIFDAARLNIEIKDRFGQPVVPREWFLVPLFVIDEAVERIKDGTITGYVYDPKAAALVNAHQT